MRGRRRKADGERHFQTGRGGGPPDQRFFEQAIFIVRNDAAGEGVTARELVEEARRVARNYAGGDHGRFSRIWRDLSPAVYTLMGAAGIGLVWLTVWLI